MRGVPTYIRPAPPAKPAVIVHAGALVERPDDLPAWKVARACVELPPNARVHLDDEVELVTRDGWPVVVARGVATDDHGAVFEHRLLAYYNFLHLVGVVMVRAIDPTAFDAHRSEIDDIVRSAHPDFRDGAVISLGELWQL